jgi:hypothetical protein
LLRIDETRFRGFRHGVAADGVTWLETLRSVLAAPSTKGAVQSSMTVNLEAGRGS